MDSPKPRKLKLFFGKKELLLLGVSFLCGLCPIAPYVNPFGLAFVFSRRRICLLYTSIPKALKIRPVSGR